MTPEERKVVVRRYVEEICSTGGNLGTADQIIDASWGDGPDWIKKTIAEQFTAFPDLRREITDMVVEGEKVVLYSTYTGTHQGIWTRIPFAPTGARVTMPFVATFIVNGGRIVDEVWNCLNLERDVVHPLAKATCVFRSKMTSCFS